MLDVLQAKKTPGVKTNRNPIVCPDLNCTMNPLQPTLNHYLTYTTQMCCYTAYVGDISWELEHGRWALDQVMVRV